jgi:hypothetical protein
MCGHDDTLSAQGDDMTRCSTFKALMGALGLATIVGPAADASAFSGLTRDAMSNPRDAAPLLELARRGNSPLRDHRKNPSPPTPDFGKPRPHRPRPADFQPKPPPPKSGKVPWQKKYPSRI